MLVGLFLLFVLEQATGRGATAVAFSNNLPVAKQVKKLVSLQRLKPNGCLGIEHPEYNLGPRLLSHLPPPRGKLNHSSFFRPLRPLFFPGGYPPLDVNNRACNWVSLHHNNEATRAEQKFH